MKFKVVVPGKGDIQLVNIATKYSLNSWHKKMAHQNYPRVKEVLSKFNIDVSNKEEPFCDDCARGKIHRLPFPTSKTRTSRIGEIIHADVCGPFQVPSKRGSKYFLLFKDDFSHFRTVYFIASKADVHSCARDFLKKSEKHCPLGVKILRTDNGLEFCNQQMDTLLKEYGVHHERTVVYSPEQNGCAERENRTLVEAARTMIHSKGFEKSFWAEAINTAAYVLNCTGTSTVKGVTPYELWYGK